MRIATPRLEARDGQWVVSARVDVPDRPAGMPEALSFATDERPGIKLSDRADAFLAGLLPVAMRMGEDLEVAGPVSTRLAHDVENYQAILNTWWPERYARIDIRYETLEERECEPRPAGVGCCFSAGLDSFSSVYELLPGQMPFEAFQITNAVMINGFDQLSDYRRDGDCQRMYEQCATALSQWGVDLMMIFSNLKPFREAVLTRGQLVSSFGSALSACAHALAPVFGRFSLSGHATYRHADLKPQGSHPALDHLLSTDQLQIIHRGAQLSRSEKLEQLLDEPPVQDCLRVCFKPPFFDPDSGRVLNCGACEKCIRTIITLDMLGRLQDFPTFRHRHPVAAYRKVEVLRRIPGMFLDDLIRLAGRVGSLDWLRLLQATAELKASQKAARRETAR